MNIGELDKGKLEQCVINEERRLESINDSLEKIITEYDRKKTEFDEILKKMSSEIKQLLLSKGSAERFISGCKNQLNKLENE